MDIIDICKMNNWNESSKGREGYITWWSNHITLSTCCDLIVLTQLLLCYSMTIKSNSPCVLTANTKLKNITILSIVTLMINNWILTDWICWKLYLLQVSVSAKESWHCMLPSQSPSSVWWLYRNTSWDWAAPSSRQGQNNEVVF